MKDSGRQPATYICSTLSRARILSAVIVRPST